MTRFYKTDPNRTSGKVKLLLPVDSYTIVLLVLTLSTTIYLRLILQMSFLGGVESLNGGFWPCRGPGLARTSSLLMIILAIHYFCYFFSVDFATYQPLRNQQAL